MALPGTHWRTQKLPIPKNSEWERNFKPGTLQRHYLYNSKGLLIGRVEPTPTGFWKGWVGRPGVEVPGMFESPTEAKAACEGCFQQ